MKSPKVGEQHFRLNSERPVGELAVYRPTMRLSLGDELRLLDQALDEARDRVRTVDEPKLLEPPAVPATVQMTETPPQMPPSRPPDAPIWLAPPEPARPSGEGELPFGNASGDRTRILAALICILQQELVRDK